MAKKEVGPCVGCEFAAWQYTNTGKIKHVAGRCEKPIPKPVLPLAVMHEASDFHKGAIWPDLFIGETCPTREPKKPE